MKVRYAFKVLSPGIHVLVLEWNSINTVLRHERVCSRSRTMDVKLFLEQCIHRNVEREARSLRTSCAELVIEIEASCALLEELNFRTREFPLLSAVVPVA